MMNYDQYKIAKNVHAYRQGNLNIAYDVNSGSLHVLDDVSFAVLKCMMELQAKNESITIQGIQDLMAKTAGSGVLNFPAQGENEIREILEEFEELAKEGSLFSAQVLEAGPQYPDPPVIKALCLHVAHDCNLRCEYCFAGTGAFGGGRGLMDLETGKKGIDFILQASRHRNHCEVDFFGGEPLLNFDVVKALVHYGNEKAADMGKSIKFTLTTNAVLLDEKVQEFLAQENISIVLSLDGRPEVHDRMRPYANGRGSYDQVITRLQEYVAKQPHTSPYTVGTYYYVRGTFTHFNLDFDQDVKHMDDLGIKHISLEPVVAKPQAVYAFQEGDLPSIIEAYNRLGEQILQRRQKDDGFSFFHFNVALDQGPCLPKRLSGCGAGYEYVAISPEGDIYPCHQFVGQEQYKMGSLLSEDPVALEQKIVEAFRTAHVFNKPSCLNCWARFACSGGCHAANTAFTGKLTEVYELGCELQRKRLEVALYLKVKEAQGLIGASDGVPASNC